MLYTKILTTILGLTFAAFSASAAEDCSMTSPAGTTYVDVMQTSQFTSFMQNQRLAVYSCGSFVNDGSVPEDSQTDIIEMEIGSCKSVRGDFENHLMYCQP